MPLTLNDTKVHSRPQMEDVYTYNDKRNWKNRRKYLTPMLLSFYQTKNDVLLLYAGAALWVICNTTSGIPYFTDESSSAFLLLWQTFKRVTFFSFTTSIFYSLNSQCQFQGENIPYPDFLRVSLSKRLFL